MNDIEAQVEVINARMFKKRLNQDCSQYIGWKEINDTFASFKARDVIKEHLLLGHKVTAGYFATSVRGYHRYSIFWKEKTNG